MGVICMNPFRLMRRIHADYSHAVMQSCHAHYQHPHIKDTRQYNTVIEFQYKIWG